MSREVRKSRDCRRYQPPKYIFIQILCMVLLSYICAFQHQQVDWQFSPQLATILKLPDRFRGMNGNRNEIW